MTMPPDTLPPDTLRQYAALVEQTRLDPEATRRILKGARLRVMRHQRWRRATAAGAALLCLALGWGLYQDQQPRETRGAAAFRSTAPRTLERRTPEPLPGTNKPLATYPQGTRHHLPPAPRNRQPSTRSLTSAGGVRGDLPRSRVNEDDPQPRAGGQDQRHDHSSPRLWRALDREATFLLGAHRLTLAPGSQVRVLSTSVAGAVLRVDGGSAHFSIKPLAGKRFRVQTAQMEVEVVGTRFTVAVDSSCSRVSVDRGRVLVKSRQGASWSLTAGSGRTLCSEPTRPEVLTPEEQLIHRALTLLASDAELNRAESLLEQYLKEFPAGSFIQEAHYQLVFALARLGRTEEAHEHGRRFLRRFPDGELANKVRLFINP